MISIILNLPGCANFLFSFTISFFLFFSFSFKQHRVKFCVEPFHVRWCNNLDLRNYGCESTSNIYCKENEVKRTRISNEHVGTWNIFIHWHQICCCCCFFSMIHFFYSSFAVIKRSMKISDIPKIQLHGI